MFCTSSRSRVLHAATDRSNMNLRILNVLAETGRIPRCEITLAFKPGTATPVSMPIPHSTCIFGLLAGTRQGSATAFLFTICLTILSVRRRLKLRVYVPDG